MNEKIPDNSLFINNWKLVLLVLILASVFRLWGAFDLTTKIEDENLHVSDAVSLGTYGLTANWGWHHPQLSGLIMYGTIRTFGDNPVGWRSSNIFFGTASVALLFLIGRLLYPGTAVPILAMSLLAFDPHLIYISRTSFVEIPVTFFFLLFLYLLLEYTENRRKTLPFAGLAMGLTMGTKAYFVFAFPVAMLYAFYRMHQRNKLTLRVLVDFGVAICLLPFAVYLFSYFQWFSRGYTLYEFVQMKIDAVTALKELTIDNFSLNRDYLEAGGKPWEWFIKPIFWGHQQLLNSEMGIFLIQCSNPPFRLLVLPSIFIASFYAWKRRSAQELLVPLLFVCCYLLILVARRPIFSYSVTALLPFAYLAIARTVTMVAVKIDKIKTVQIFFFLATLSWGAYMFPIASARMVPIAFYRPILSILRYLGNF